MQDIQPSPKKSSTTLTVGLAMFAMFFGAGNIVFPLALGQYAQDQTLFAILGLLITAVGVPFLGLISMTLFNGNYTHFFERIGKIPGFVVTVFIMGLIGPFGAIPRCITLSHSTFSMFWSGVSLSTFSIISCLLIFLFTFRKNRLLEILGIVLTPLLLISMGIIIVKGFFNSPSAPISDFSSDAVFLLGLLKGYQTMDLLGAFFFSTIILECLESNGLDNSQHNYRKMVFLTLKASLIGASLLAISYIGFCYVAAFNSETLQGVLPDQLLGVIAMHILGPYAGLVAIIAVALACLTTAIALAAVFAEFLHHRVTFEKLPYISSLILTLFVTYFVSTLSFSGIASFLVPILEICYPALVLLSALNIAHKLYHFNPVKIPVLLVFLISFVYYFIKS
jgi:LIVCS family branched-chain amino acid:cation transporter